MSLGGIAIAIGATVDAEIVMIEASQRSWSTQLPTRIATNFSPRRPRKSHRRFLLSPDHRYCIPAVFTLPGQAGRLFKPLAYTKTAVMLISASSRSRWRRLCATS